MPSPILPQSAIGPAVSDESGEYEGQHDEDHHHDRARGEVGQQYAAQSCGCQNGRRVHPGSLPVGLEGQTGDGLDSGKGCPASPVRPLLTIPDIWAAKFPKSFLLRYARHVKASDAVGPRIAEIRKRRGLTQAQLAQLANVGKGTLAKVESGHASASTNWVGAIANALGVDASKIYGPDDDFAQADLVGPLIRRALATTDLVNGDQPAPIAELQQRVAQVNAWRHDTKYTKIGEVLPDLIDQLLVSGQVSGGAAYTLLTDAYRAANTVAHKLGYTDLSITASERMEWAAEKSGDPLLLATVHYVRAATLARIGAGSQAMHLLVRAMSEIDPLVEEDETAAAVYSTLHMRAGVIAAAMANGDTARTHLAEAERLAVGFGDRVIYETPVGPTNVKLYQVCAEVDLGNVGRAVEIAKSTRLPDGMARERKAYFWLDAARAHLLARDTDAAIEALYESRAASPEHFRASRTAKATVKTAAAQQRRASDGLRALANAAGIED